MSELGESQRSRTNPEFIGTSPVIKDAAIVIPWRMSDGYRQVALQWLLRYYAHEFPDWPVFIGTCDTSKWSKARAVAHAVTRIRLENANVLPDVLVISDADVYVDARALRQAVAAVLAQSARWAIPFRVIVRLNEDATKRVIAGDLDPFEASKHPSNWQPNERPYTHEAAGGLVVVDSMVWRDVPLDPRFEGFGSEDFAWADALECLAGPRLRLDSRLVHLYHTPQKRISRSLGSFANGKLRREYRRAKDSQLKMRAIVEQARLAFGVESLRDGV